MKQKNDNKILIKLKDKKDYSIKDIVLFSLLFIWMIIPILKMIQGVSLFTVIYEYRFMEIVGIIGIYLFAFEIYKKIKTTENKKLLIKELLPIIILVGYLIWTLISCIFAQDRQKAFYGDAYRKEGFITYLIYAGFFACAFLIKSDKLKRCLLNSFIIIAIINIILINLTNNSIQMLKIFHFKNIQVGVFSNSNHYGYYLLLATITACLSFIVEKNKIIKSFYGLAYLILIYNLILNNTFGCYIAFAITMILFFVYCIYQKKNRLISAVSIFIFVIISCFVQYNGKNIVVNNAKILFNDIGSIFDVAKNRNDYEKDEQIENIVNDKNEKNDISKSKNNSIISSEAEKKFENAGSGRAKLWKYGLKIFLEKPILGYGADNLESEYKKYDIEQDRPHNLIIQLATTSGLPGCILYMIAIGLILVRTFKRLNDSNCIYTIVFFAVIAYLISAMFGNSMYYTSPYYFIFLGITYSTMRSKTFR